MKSSSRNIEEWDFGSLSILTTLDKKFKNKVSKLEKLATAETEDICNFEKAKLVS